MCDVSARCKALAVEHDCPLILLSQLNREAAKTGVAKSHHLKESGSFEQDADVVIFVRWPWKADPEREQPHRYVFKITKNRNRPIVNWNVEAVINPARQTITRGF
jgi:replicative DNA helicase